MSTKKDMRAADAVAQETPVAEAVAGATVEATVEATAGAVADETEETFEGGLIPSVSAAEAEAQMSENELAKQAIAKSQATVRSLAQKLGIADSESLSALLSQATGALQAEVQALRAELATVQSTVRADKDGMFGEDASVGGYPWQLYRFPVGYGDGSRDGWLVVLPGGATPKGNRDTGSYTRMLKKGLIPITKYGPAPVPTTSRGADVFLDFFRRFPQFAGEFPASQVVAYNWHVAPPLKGLKFPQYEAVANDVMNVVCEGCGETSYFMADNRDAGPAYLRHLMNLHRYPFREAAEAVRNAFDLAGKPVKLNVAAYRPGSIEDAMKNTRPQ